MCVGSNLLLLPVSQDVADFDAVTQDFGVQTDVSGDVFCAAQVVSLIDDRCSAVKAEVDRLTLERDLLKSSVLDLQSRLDAHLRCVESEVESSDVIRASWADDVPAYSFEVPADVVLNNVITSNSAGNKRKGKRR
eukprot:TRINITY_DN87600_c0_g1_i1.p1 TRINITY_DN87600_c0_g1~~TRINITY_DN87600_c0_g1_i1.p1  ORF type:complete len:135 (-),score=19.97 TRINITY_DN87600_c0_g1_i1:41-445(-)